MNIKYLSRTLIITASLCLLGLFTGCFRIVEKVDFKTMDSGTFTMVTDLSEMYKLMSSMEESGEEPDQEEMEQEFVELENELKPLLPLLQQVPGITSASTSHDTANYSASIQFDFTSIEALNKGMSIIYSKQLEMEEIQQNTYFKSKKNRIERTDTRDMIDFLRKDMEDDSAEAAQFFQTASFELQYSFPKKIKKVTNQDVDYEKKGDTLTYSYYLFQEDFKEKPIGTTVRF